MLYTVSGKSCSAIENFFFFTGAMIGSVTNILQLYGDQNNFIITTFIGLITKLQNFNEVIITSLLIPIVFSISHYIHMY